MIDCTKILTSDLYFITCVAAAGAVANMVLASILMGKLFKLANVKRDRANLEGIDAWKE